MTDREAINLLENSCTISDLFAIDKAFSSSHLFYDDPDSKVIPTHEASHADVIEYCFRVVEELAEEEIVVDNVQNDMFYSVVKTRTEDHFAFITISSPDINIVNTTINKIVEYVNQDYPKACEIVDRTYDELRAVYYFVIKF